MRNSQPTQNRLDGSFSPCESGRTLVRYCLLLFCTIAITNRAHGQVDALAPTERPTETPIVLQTIPASDLPRFLTNERPVRRSIFDDFLKSRAMARVAGQEAPAEIQIPRAVYDARFHSEGFIDGVARIEFVSRSEMPLVLPISDLRLSITEMKWKDRQDPVRWGIAPDQRLVLVVPRSGELELEWSSRAARVGSDHCDFDFNLLQAARTEFTLAAPRNWNPAFDGNPSSTAVADDADGVRHRFQLGTARNLHLHIENSLSPTIANPTYWVRMISRYDIGRQGADVVAELEIETASSPVSKLPLRIDRPLQLVAARMGDQLLSWAPAQEGSDHSLELRFDPPLVESGRKIRLEARAALQAEQLASLPRIRPPDAHLREAELELNMAPPLELAGIELQDARIADTGAVVSPRGGESRRIRLISPSADIRCAFDVPEFRGKVRYAARVTAGETTWELDALCRLTVESGERFDLLAAISPGWVVDSVESTPAGAVENWSVVTEQSHQKLSLRLLKALAPKAPIAIRVVAHMPRVNGDPLSSKLFRLGNFDALIPEAGFLQLHASPGIRVDAGAGAQRVNLKAMQPADLEMITPESTGAVYKLLPQNDFPISHSVSGAEFRVTSASRALLEQDRIVNQHRLIVTPQRQQLERVLVRVLPSTGQEVLFDLENAKTQRLTTRLAASDPKGDLWEVRFSEPISNEFTLSATETTPAAPKTRLRTLRCDGAASHDSTLRIFGTSQRQWDIAGSGVQLLLSRSDSLAPLEELAAYRYGFTDNPVIELARKEMTPRSPNLWSSIDGRVTFVGEEATQLHLSSYYLETPSALEAQFQIPAESQVDEVRLNGLPISSFRFEGSTLCVSLPASRSTHLLQIQVAAKSQSPVLWITPVKWQGAIPKFATLSESWTIWTPPGAATVAIYPQWSLRNPVSLFEREPNSTADNHNSDISHQGAISLTSSSEGALKQDESHLRASGWTATIVGGQAISNQRMIWYSQSSWRLMGWCALIVSLVVVYSLLSGRTVLHRLAAAVVIGLALLTLIVPAPFCLVLSGGFLGGVFGWLVWSLKGLSATGSTTVPGGSILSSASGSNALLALIATVVWSGVGGGVAFGQAAPQPQKASDAQRPRNVFDPVDEDGKPAGDYVYVSPEFFEELALLRPAQAADPCILTEARYRLARSTSLVGESLLLGVEFVYFATVDSEVVPLLIDTKATPIANQELFVDGQRRILPKSAGNRPPQIELLGRGLHIIKLGLQISLQKENDFSVANWRTLPLPMQYLEIETDSSLVWQLNGIEVRRDPANPTTKIPLTPGSELKLAVHRVAPATTSAEMPLEHDAWITLSLGSIAVEHRVQIGPESSASSILFELDEGFTLDSVVGDNRQAISPVSLGNRRFRARLESPADEPAEIRILCSIKSGLGLNRLTSTGIQFPGAQVAKARIGLSASSDYALQTEIRSGVSELSTTEFIRPWPQGRTPPRLAFSVEPGKSWNVDVRPSPSEASASLQAEYLLHPSEIQLQWDAEVTSGGESISLYVLQVPPTLRVDSISVQEATVNRLVRFTRTASDRITLFMRTASVEPRRIRLRGAIDMEGSGLFALPALTLENAVATSHVLRVFRADDAQVEIKQAKGLRTIDLATRATPVLSTLQPEQSRLFAEFEVLAPSQPWEVQLTAVPNSPQVSHKSIARFETRQSKWRLDQEFKLAIQNAVADELIFEMPPGVREPVEISPSEPFQIIRDDNQPPRLVIRPAQPWKDARQLRISAEYSPENGASELTFAPLRLTGSTLQAGWIATPKQAGVGAFIWKGQGSDELAPPQGESKAADFQWFMQRDASATVQLQREVAASNAASVRLEGQVALSGNRFTAVLTWFWGSASTQETTLSAPEGLQILRARVIGSSARLTQLDDRLWKLSSTLGAAPPALEVVCQGKYSPGDPIPLPTLKDASTQESLITVYTSREWMAGQAQDQILSTSAAFQARLRLLDQTKREAQTILPTLGELESLNWRRCWLEHWDAARAFPAHSRDTIGAPRPITSKWLEQADVDRARFAADLQASTIDAAPSESTEIESPTADLVLNAAAAPRQSIHFFAEGTQPLIQLVRRDSMSLASESIQTAFEGARWLLPTSAVGILLFLALALAPQRRRLLLRFAPLVGWIALGSIWWAWFTPFWFGPIIAAAAVLCLIASTALKWSKKSWSRPFA